MQNGMLSYDPVRHPCLDLREEDLPEEPAWFKAVSERAKNSPLAKMSEEEIGQWVEELAERGAKKHQASKATS